MDPTTTRQDGRVLPTWTPELGVLDLLVTVARSGSIARAAQEHGITQPSASTRLARLERRLGITLLVRSPSGTTLTPAGEAVVAWAGEVIAAARALTDGVLTLRSDADATLRVAASLTVAEYLLPPWLLTLRTRHPDLDVAAVVANSHEVAERVRAGAVDIGFIEAPELPAGTTGQHVGADTLALVASPAYPLTPAAHRLRAADLLELQLLLREPGSGTRDTFLHALTHALGGSQPPPLTHAITLGSTATIVAATRAGGGVGVLSERAVAADVAAGQLVRLDVPDLALRRPLTAIWAGRRPTPLAQELIGIAASRG